MVAAAVGFAVGAVVGLVVGLVVGFVAGAVVGAEVGLEVDTVVGAGAVAMESVIFSVWMLLGSLVSSKTGAQATIEKLRTIDSKTANSFFISFLLVAIIKHIT